MHSHIQRVVGKEEAGKRDVPELSYPPFSAWPGNARASNQQDLGTEVQHHMNTAMLFPGPVQPPFSYA